MFPFLIMPWLPTNCDKPQTLYSIMNSICNFGKEEKTNIYNLPAGAREKIFDFTYPLSSHINKEEFEIMILKHYIKRRIGFDTVTEFKLALDSKLNEVMPKYNKLFDILDGWDLFNNGEVVTRITSDSGNSTTNVSNSNTSERKNSNVPQNELQDIQDGNYMTDYNYDTDTGSGNSTTNTSGTTNETISRSPSDKIKIYKEFLENIESIYSLIYKDLDELFYGLD